MNRFYHVIHRRTAVALGLTGMMLGLGSCKRLTEKMEITETREISSYAPPVQTDIPSKVRFYDNEPAPAPARTKLPLAWDTPEGWKEAEEDASGMRMINLTFGPNGEGECYFSALPGRAGGLEANINRWRAQMGLPDLTNEQIAELPKRTMFGREATYVEMDGDFKGMGSTDTQKGYRMIGLVQPAPEFTLFVKMTGPGDLVKANEPAFEKFCQSITVSQ